MDISANTERNLVLGSIAIIVLSVLFGFATSVPELGGTVGYELNLFLQDYIEKQGHFDFDFWSDHLRYF
jgi:S-DNA-T family DNA segregation ATPase FtsK/SpoIIIE